MKKHIIRILTVLLLVCLGAALFAACGETETPQKETYTVTYAAGGGTGTGPASEKYEEGATFKVKENSFTRDGYTFKTWNDGTKDYAAGATYTMPKKDVTFTAQWTEDGGKPEPAAKVTVTYSLGENTTGKAPAAQEVDKGGQVTLPAAPVWEGHTFKGWKVGSDATLKNAGDKITVNENVTVTAQWETAATPVEKVTVTFNLGGVPALNEKDPDTAWETPAAEKVEKDSQYTLPAAPAWWAGHMFTGWKVGDGEVKKAGEEIKVSADVTLTAQWKEAQSITEVKLDATDNAMYIVVAGTYEGYTDEAMLDALEDGNQRVLKFSVCIGQDPWTYQDLDILSEAEDGTYTVEIDVTDLDPQYPYAITENRNGYGNIRAVAVDDTKVVGGLKYYLHGGVGSDLLLNISNANTTYDITDITLEQAENKAYLVFTGNFEGYTEAALKELLEDVNTFFFYGNGSAGNQKPESRTATFADGKWTLKVDITDMPDDIEYAICQINVNDLKHPKADSTDSEIKVGTRTYKLVAHAWGGWVRLTISTEKGTCAVTGLDIEVDETAQKVYLIATGTFADYTEAELKELFTGKNKMYVHFWDEKAGMENPTSVVVTTEGGNWTAKCDVTDLKAGELRNVLIGGELKLDIQDKTVTLGNKTFTLQKANGYGNTGLKVEVETAPTDPVYEVTAFTIEKQANEKVYLIYKGTCANYEQAALEAALKALPLHFNVYKIGGSNTGAEGNGWTFAMNGGTWEMKLNITVGDNDLFTVGGTYFIDSLNNYTDGGKYFNLWNTEVVVELGTNKYKAGGPLTEPNTWGNVTFTIEGEAAEEAVYNLTDITLEKTETVVYFVASGSHNYSDTEQLKTVLNNVKFDFGEISEIEKQIEVTANSWSIKFDVTNLAAQANPYYFHFFSNPADGDIRLQNEHAEDGAFVELAGKKYSIVNKGDGVNTWNNATYWGCVCLKVETTAPAVEVTFSEPTSATLEVMKSDGREEGKLFREEVDAAFLVLTGTYTGDATLELAQDYFSQAKYSFKFTAKEWKDRLRRISIDTSEKTWTVKYDVTSLPVGDNKCVLKGSDLKLTVSEDATKSVKSLGSTFTLTNIAEGVLAVNVKHNYTITGVDLEQDEDGTPRLVMEGTYEEAVWSGDEIKKFLLDDDVRTLCLNLSTYIWPMNDYYSADVTATDGNFTVKLDISRLSPRQNDLVLSEGSGYGDIKNVTVNKTLTVGNKVYTLTGTDGGNCTLTVAEIPKEYSVTTATIEQASEKINLVLSGTYAGYTDAEFTTYLQNVYYDIQHNDNLDKKGWDRLHSFARTASAAEGQWTFTIDITKLNVGSYGIHFDSTDGVGGENENTKNLQPTDTQLNDKTFNIGTKTFKFVYDSSSNKAEYFWGTLGVIVTDTNAATISFTKAQLTSDESHVYLVLTANVNGYTQQDLETMIYIGELDSMRVTVSEVTLAEGVATLKFDFTEQRPNGKWWWGHYMINGLESLNVVCPIDTGSDAKTVTVTVGGYKYTLRHNDEIAASENEQIIITIDPV